MKLKTKLIRKIRHYQLLVYRETFRHMPIKKNKIVMWANDFKHYGCSPKYITEYILKTYPRCFDVVWVLKKGVSVPTDLPEEIRVVRYFSKDFLKELHTAKFVICNMRTRISFMWKKRKGQIYIQTWHSSLRLKKIEKDAEERLEAEYLRSSKEDSEKIDLLLSGCAFSSEIFKRAFWYNGKILECGTPRSDLFFSDNSQIRKKVYDYFDIPSEKKLILYAPTFRTNKPSDYLGMDFVRLLKTLGEDWAMGARLHPNVSATVTPESAINMSAYPDMQELIASADILITDYSSCMFDMAIAKKICVLYAPDLDEYLKKERGLYFSLYELPFPIAQTMDSLCDLLSHFDAKRYYAKLEDFMNSIGSFEDGHAAERVCDFIRQKQTKKTN